MCTVLLPPGGYPIAVKYISYQEQTGNYEHICTHVIYLNLSSHRLIWLMFYKRHTEFPMRQKVKVLYNIGKMTAFQRC